MQPDADQPESASVAIRQDELERYRKLSAEARELNWLVESLRKILLHKHAQGLPVEPGPLDLEVSESSQRRLTTDELIRILGLSKAEEVRNQIEPTVSKTMKVVDRPVRPTAKGRRRNVA